MFKNRILLVFAVCLLTILMFSLPKVVVDNEENEVSTEVTAMEQPEHSSFDHGNTMSDSSLIKANFFREKIKNSEVNKKSLTFADSLVDLFQKNGQLDSVASYLEWKAMNFPNEENILNAGLGYYEAFGYAIDKVKLKKLGEKSREYLSQILDKHPDRLDIKTKIAMTYVSSPQPMQGIQMLKEVVQADSNHVEAIFNLGLLSRKSGQLDKAVERFDRLLSIDQSNIQARFLLAISHLELGHSSQAKVHFDKIKNTSSDLSVLATVDKYLKNLK